MQGQLSQHYAPLHRLPTKPKKKKHSKSFWFACRHNLPTAVNCYALQKSGETFVIFVGHNKKPLEVTIAKIRRLPKTKYGKRFKLQLSHKTDKQNLITLNVIYNGSNSTMVIGPIPKFLLK